MERDIRRNAGYATIMIRRLDPWMPYAWMIRLGYCAMPLFVVARALKGWWRCICMGRHSGVAWYELPIAFCLVTVVHALEIPGMLNALRNQDVGETNYR